MAKEKKERAKEYNKKLVIDGTLDDVLKVSIPKKEKETKVVFYDWRVPPMFRMWADSHGQK